METLEVLQNLYHSIHGPHSLGTLIEWKPDIVFILLDMVYSPHSLGTLIEWKLSSYYLEITYPRPHSLGTLIEWKPLSQLLDYTLHS